MPDYEVVCLGLILWVSSTWAGLPSPWNMPGPLTFKSLPGELPGHAE
jgi:hypothetical protein